MYETNYTKMLRLEIEVHPQVYSELENACSWYEERAENLGNEFLEEVDGAVNTIKDSPKHTSTKKLRRAGLLPFSNSLLILSLRCPGRPALRENKVLNTIPQIPVTAGVEIYCL